jgi:hypothetical protein
MKPSPVPLPAAQLFVCVNRRAAGDALGDGCGDRGEAVYATLKRDVTAARAAARIWVTRTYCLGICPKAGATVARHFGERSSASPGPALFTDVTTADVPTLLGPLLGPR